MDQKVQLTENAMDDRALMTCCIQGLLRHAYELGVVQGAEAKGKMVELRNFTQEIIAFWDLDGAIFETPCEAG